MIHPSMIRSGLVAAILVALPSGPILTASRKILVRIPFGSADIERLAGRGVVEVELKPVRGCPRICGAILEPIP